MSTFKTPKGTTLPILSLKGKDYLQVQHRLVWFREECPQWGIETIYLELSDKSAIAKATIKNADGRIIAQATKSETPEGFGDYIEKAESGAIGRALAMCGYGTQFTVDLDEGERIVDSPAPSAPQHSAGPSDGGSYVLRFGKFIGKTLDQVGAAELRGYHEWLKKNQKPGEKDSEAMQKIAAYVATRTPKQ